MVHNAYPTAPQYNLEDVEEDSEFAPYATPDPEIVKMKSKRRQLEEQNILKNSENQKLLKDALEDLSGDESPPEIPKQNFGVEVRKVPSVESQSPSGSTNKVCLWFEFFTHVFSRIQLEHNKETTKPSKSPKLPLPKEQSRKEFPVLKAVKQDFRSPEKKKTELSQIKLKRATDWKVSSWKPWINYWNNFYSVQSMITQRMKQQVELMMSLRTS